MKPVVLLFFANDLEDIGQNLRKLAVEARAIEQTLISADEMCEFHIQKNTTADDIRRVLARFRNRVAIFHYAGHAESLRLMLETEKGEREGFRAETLAAYLRNQDNLELVFLNGCSTDDQVDLLLDVGVPHVIATSQEIDDTVATSLSTKFYEGIAFGSSVDIAWREAVAATKQIAVHSPRGAHFGDKVDNGHLNQGRFPWSLHSRPGIDPVSHWNLPDASNNPLFGLPSLPDDIEFPEEPFQQLKRFTRDEARVFYGRGNEIRALFHDVTNPHASPVILYYGQSGVGKSSLLDAGLLPRLECNTRTVYIRRSANGAASDLTEALGGADGGSLLEQWHQMETRANQPVVIILDQLEEAFSHQSQTDGATEIAALASLMRILFRDRSTRPRGKIILVFRKEWYPEIDGALKAEKVSRSGVFLKRLSRQGVQKAITLSSDARHHYSLTFENDDLPMTMATELLADKDSPLAPTLQILLATLWDHARKISRSEPCFTNQLYSTLKTRGIQMGDFLDSQIARVAERHPVDEKSGLLLSILEFHCSKLGTALQKTASQRAAFFGENIERVDAITGACMDVFLLTDSSSDSSESDDATRLAHDTLAPLVLQRFHESNRLTQRAGRILALRTQTPLDSDEVDLLTRTESRTISRARSSMRRLTDVEEQLVRSSRQAFRKLNFRWGGLAITLLIAVASLTFWFRSQVQSREVLRRSELLRNASSITIQEMMPDFLKQEKLTWRAINNVTKADHRPSQRSRRSASRINIALLRSYLGKPDYEDLVSSFSDAGPDDILAYQSAFQSADEEGLRRLGQLIGDQAFNENGEADGSSDTANVIQMRARLTWLLLLIDRASQVPQSWFEPSPEAGHRTRLIMALADWFVDEPGYRQVLDKQMDPHLLAVVCQSFYFLSDAQLAEGLGDHLGIVLLKHMNHPGITVRSSARAALTRLGQLPRLDSPGFELAMAGDDWFSIRLPGKESTVMDFARVATGTDREFWMATTESPMLLAAVSLSGDRKQRREKAANPSAAHFGFGGGHQGSGQSSRLHVKLNGGDAAARFAIWSDALECCNWLNRHVLAMEPAYQSSADEQFVVTWSLANTTGFRLPLADEWSMAAAAASKNTYSFGDNPTHMQHFGCTLESSERHATPIAHKLPNAFGFFDMHGNLQEWCWPSNGAGQFQPQTSEVEGNRVLTQDGSYLELMRESGLDHPGDPLANDKREWYMGFRLATSRRIEVPPNESNNDE